MSVFGCFSGSNLRKSAKRNWKKESSNETRADRFITAVQLIAVLKSLCLVLGVDFYFTVQAAHPCFDEHMMSKNISKKAIKRLTSLAHTLREIKIQRVHKLQEHARNLTALWNSLDIPTEQRQSFLVVARHLASSVDQITEPYTLSLDSLKEVEAEVFRLEVLKSTKSYKDFKKELKKHRRLADAKIQKPGSVKAGGKRVSPAPSNSNNDNRVIACHNEREEEEEDNQFKDYF